MKMVGNANPNVQNFITTNRSGQRGGYAANNPLLIFQKVVQETFRKIPEPNYLKYSEDLDFSAPGAVPGFTDQTVTVEGVELGDTVLIGCSITAPAGFMPPIGFVSAADTITVRWLQVTGAAADPDGAGATYTIDIWRH